jgi:hypothetical protein
MTMTMPSRRKMAPADIAITSNFPSSFTHIYGYVSKFHFQTVECNRETKRERQQMIQLCFFIDEEHIYTRPKGTI